ncbi:MAG: FeoA family protein [Bacillota bacterium]
MKLDRARRGQRLRIVSLPDELTRARSMQFGISEGTEITCLEVIPAGPIVIARNRQEIAIGRNLARLIGVEPLAAVRPGCGMGNGNFKTVPDGV